jgi:protein-disulfide isomerase
MPVPVLVRFFACLLLAVVAWGADKSALDKATLEAYIRHLVLYPSQVKVTIGDPKPTDLPGFVEVLVRAEAGQASEERSYLVSKDGRKVLEAKVFDINQNPFQHELQTLKTEGAPSLGVAGAPVTIVLFSDFQCSYCKQEADAIRTQLTKTFPNDVRVFFKDFPLTAIHPWAERAAYTGGCVFQAAPALFWDYHDWAFSRQGELTPENFEAQFSEFAAGKKLDAAKVISCAAADPAKVRVAQSVAEGRTLGVTSTPTMFINGRKIPGYLPWENLKQVIEIEARHAAASSKPPEPCCTLPLPGVLPK